MNVISFLGNDRTGDFTGACLRSAISRNGSAVGFSQSSWAPLLHICEVPEVAQEVLDKSGIYVTCPQEVIEQRFIIREWFGRHGAVQIDCCGKFPRHERLAEIVYLALGEDRLAQTEG